MTRSSEALTLDAPDARERLAAAEAAVVVDPYILSGTPVIRGTRIPVHDIAELMKHEPLEEILEDYPGLTRETAELATIYAAAHPAEDRPAPSILERFPGAVLRYRKWVPRKRSTT